MKSSFPTPALALLAGLLLLAGCAGPSPRAPAPVSTRPVSPPPPPPPPPPEDVRPERIAPDVDVTPMPLESPAVVEPRPLTEPSSARAAGAPPSAPRQPAPAGTEASPGAAPEAPSPSRTLAYAAPVPPSSPAISDLLREVRRHWADGRHEMAAASLERALRIEPRNAYLWQHLAALRLEQGRAGQAEQFAAKSNSFAGDSVALRLRNWRIIAAARRQAGDTNGARAAERRAANYER